MNYYFYPLQSFYADKFGHDRIEIIKDSNLVDPIKLDDEKVICGIYFFLGKLGKSVETTLSGC